MQAQRHRVKKQPFFVGPLHPYIFVIHAFHAKMACAFFSAENSVSTSASVL